MRTRSALIAALLFTACPPAPVKSPAGTVTETWSDIVDSSGTPTSDRLPTVDASEDCLAVPLTAELCAETTATLAGSVNYGDFDHGLLVASGSGVVVEVGDQLPELPGTNPIQPLARCSGQSTRQVRLMDEWGAEWTFGWRVDVLETDVGDPAFQDGALISFLVVEGAETGLPSLMLRDDSSVLFVFEANFVFGAEERGVDMMLTSERCVLPQSPERWLQRRIQLDWPGGMSLLWPGQSASVPAEPAPLRYVLGESYEIEGCDDDCCNTWIAGQAER